MIDDDYVEKQYQAILAEVKAVYPLEKWVIQPRGVGYTNHKTKYGYARSCGEIQVNRLFLGTNAINKLSFTIRHELAHLAVGPAQNHNAQFRRMEYLFGALPELNRPAEIAEIKSRIPYKYTVYAHLENGEIRNLGGAHKKTKRYADYPKDGKLSISVGPVHVLRFSFEETGDERD